ncbi:MAG: 50S ribosomal protein L29 [Candidatus Aminicenantes bacterium]|uniref:Large ribosomal subunit protein uL29 n=1 Tax=Candidatus Saccharicenans subterraneus TaxID=2508984 RepID=A0A3E2BMG2_9BACT|nr:50S ribosomal protein L29 [Candidatus Aminicenantes bacterium]RFT15911.1 MAG: LSU ribosomal protein L29p (L35e) [Candidatus Saccharicenans subterraneum]
MKIRELRELSVEDLRQKELELKDQLFKLRFQKSLGQLDNPMKIRNIKKDLAKIKTLLKEFQKKGTE